jgi:hypothetical protein
VSERLLAIKAATFCRRSPAPGADGICGAPIMWLDYALSEKDHRLGFVCDAHKVSNRVEKLAQPTGASVV